MANKTAAEAAAKAAKKQKSKDVKAFSSLVQSAPKGAKLSSMAPDLIGTEDVLGHYAASCVSPFSGPAVGARVPAPYECRTITAKLHTLFSPRPSPPVIGDTYDFSCVLTASPIATIVSHSGALAAIEGGVNCNVQCFNTNDLVTDPAGGTNEFWVNVTSQDFSRGATTAANLAKLFGQYRVVSCGFRVRIESSLTNTQGRLIVARAPASPTVPLANSNYWGQGGGPTAAGDTDVLKSVYSTLGFPWQAADGALPQHVSGDVSSSILSFPDSLEVSLPSIAESGFEFVCPKTSSMHTQFIHAQAKGEYSVGEQSLVSDNNFYPGPESAPGDASYLGHVATLPRLSDNSTAGFTNVALKFVGLSTSTQVSIETIYHLEGTPAAYDVSDPSMPIPTAIKPARASAAHVDEVNSITGAIPMGRPANSSGLAVTHMLDAAVSAGTAPASRVGSALRNAGGALLGMLPGGGLVRSGLSAVNSMTGGGLSGAASRAMGSAASAVMSRLRSFF